MIQFGGPLVPRIAPSEDVRRQALAEQERRLRGTITGDLKQGAGTFTEYGRRLFVSQGEQILSDPISQQGVNRFMQLVKGNVASLKRLLEKPNISDEDARKKIGATIDKLSSAIRKGALSVTSATVTTSPVLMESGNVVTAELAGPDNLKIELEYQVHPRKKSAETGQLSVAKMTMKAPRQPKLVIQWRGPEQVYRLLKTGQTPIGETVPEHWEPKEIRQMELERGKERSGTLNGVFEFVDTKESEDFPRQAAMAKAPKDRVENDHLIDSFGDLMQSVDRLVRQFPKLEVAYTKLER